MGKSSGNLKKKGKSHSYAIYGYLFILPFFIAFVVFQLYPLLYTIFFSTQESYTGLYEEIIGPNFIGLQNFTDLFATKAGETNFIFNAFKNTFIIWIGNFIPQMLLALLLAAWFTNTRIKVRAQGFYKVVIFMPNIITAASLAVLFGSLFLYPTGPVNRFLESAGLQKFNFFRDATSTRSLIAFIQCWMWYGNTMVVLIAGILGINPSLFESAQIDGASNGQIFRKITLPSIKPILLFTLVTSLIGGLQMFDIPKLLPPNYGGPAYSAETITMYIFKIAFEGARNAGKAAAISVVLFIVTAILSAILFFMMRDKDAAKENKLRKQAMKQYKKEVANV